MEVLNMHIVPQYRAGMVMGVLSEQISEQVMLESCAWVEAILTRLCEVLAMTPLRFAEAAVCNEGEDKDGISAVLILKESHIAMHTWPQKRAFRLLIDSCKDYDPGLVLNFLELNSISRRRTKWWTQRYSD
jgi:S-adenosylmethionine decarboxylase